MNIEFHYYSLFHLCRSSGFPEKESLTIAISSQLVDDSVAPWEVKGAGKSAFTQVTQNYIFWDPSVAREIYMPFHFVPGDPDKASSRRKDGKASPWAVTADSPAAREILIDALRSKDLFRTGIALHAYADTWAHQDFSCENEEQNALEANSIVPAVGHLQALRKPDVPGMKWEDPRLQGILSIVDNNARFAAAAKMIYRFLCTSRGRGFADEEFIIGPLVDIWNGQKRNDSAARASDYIVDLDVPPYERDAWAVRSGGRADPRAGQIPAASGYDKPSWIRTAASRAQMALGTACGEIPETGYHGSMFEAWNLAVGRHKAACRLIFTKRGV